MKSAFSPVYLNYLLLQTRNKDLAGADLQSKLARISYNQ